MTGRSERIQVNGHHMRVWQVGPSDGLPVVLVHAFPLTSAMWEPQLPSLSERYRVVSYDVRGFGESEAGDGQHTMELFVDDLVALLDRLEAGPVVGCGLSMGGYVLLRAVEREPDRFRGLVLCDTRSAADDNEARLRRARAIRDLKRDGIDAFVDAFVPAVLSQATLHGRPEVVAAVERMIHRSTVPGICGALLAMAGRTDTTQALTGLRQPVLVLVGEDDAVTPPATVRAMATRIPRSELHVIEGAGHLSNLENPEAFNERLRAFLERVEAEDYLR